MVRVLVPGFAGHNFVLVVAVVLVVVVQAAVVAAAAAAAAAAADLGSLPLFLGGSKVCQSSLLGWWLSKCNQGF